MINVMNSIEDYYEDNPIKLQGNNLTTNNELKFKPLTMSNGDISVDEYSLKMQKVIAIIEKITQKVYETAKTDYIPIRISTQIVDGVKKVEIKQDGYCHVSPVSDMKKMQSISVGGFLATEWFGKKESESEAPYCTFLRSNDAVEYNIPAMHGNDRVVFYIDTHNPVFQKLVYYDFFKYYYAIMNAQEQNDLKKENQIKYSFGALSDIYDVLIEEGGVNIIKNAVKYVKKYSVSNLSENEKERLKGITEKKDWHAILGGIPPEFIYGIMIKSNNDCLIKEVKEIQKLFPNAVIFNERKIVLSNPKENNKDVKNEEENKIKE